MLSKSECQHKNGKMVALKIKSTKFLFQLGNAIIDRIEYNFRK